jgi:anti-anti-sigma factor
LPGEIDLTNVDVVRAGLFDALGDGPTTPLVVDLRPTTYLASAGVALLLDVVEHGKAVGRSVTVQVEPGSAVARILTLSGLRDLIEPAMSGGTPRP